MNRIIKRLAVAGTIAAVLASAAGTRAEEKKSDKLDKAPKSNYPLKTCVVSDEKLGDMGEPYKLKFKDKEFQLCCESCKKDFNKNPDKYLKKLVEAEKKAAKKKL